MKTKCSRVVGLRLGDADASGVFDDNLVPGRDGSADEHRAADVAFQRVRIVGLGRDLRAPTVNHQSRGGAANEPREFGVWF